MSPLWFGILILALILAIVFLLGFLAGWLFKKGLTPQPLPPQPPPQGPPPFKVPDKLDETSLGSMLKVRLAGSPADGSRSAPSQSRQVVWIDGGDEVLVHLDSIQTRIADGMLLVSIDFESDQTKRTPLVISLALGNTDDPAGLVAATDLLPRGNGLLASRWGRAAQDAVWASLLELAADHAMERGLSPATIAAAAGNLHFKAAVAPSVSSSPIGSRR
jgi:hypothetical protein